MNTLQDRLLYAEARLALLEDWRAWTHRGLKKLQRGALLLLELGGLWLWCYLANRWYERTSHD